jgi:hypothetical protein
LSEPAVNGRTNVPRFELGPAAFHGLPGKTVRMIEPVTEASPAAMLVTFLTIFGATIGPGPFMLADGSRHAARLFALIVGKTARARKGTSLRQARNVFNEVDAAFVDRRIFGGFGSGEALIEAVGGVVDGKDANDEPAEPADPRALIEEEEFSRILRVSERDGSTLSQVIRQAWDGANLSALTRKRPVRAKGAHICVVAHITEDELHARTRGGLEIANGFLNRFLLVLAERSKRLPDGSGLDRDEAERLAYEWRKAVERARAIDRVRRSPEADALWRDWYLSLDDGRPGMLGALLARAEPQVLRLSLVYALADGEATIDAQHLYAALDVWRYAEQSALAIFGDAIGDPVADLILRDLRDAPERGLTRDEIYNLLGRHERRTTIEAALDLLASRALARCDREPTGGRPTERWYAMTGGMDASSHGAISAIARHNSTNRAFGSYGAEKVEHVAASGREGERGATDERADHSAQALKPAPVAISTSTQAGGGVGDPHPPTRTTSEDEGLPA